MSTNYAAASDGYALENYAASPDEHIILNQNGILWLASWSWLFVPVSRVNRVEVAINNY
jgi:hypothetical protein